MKRRLFFVSALVFLLVFLFSLSAMAQQAWPNRGQTVEKDADGNPISDWVLGGSFTGDVAVLWGAKGGSNFSVGAGVDIISYKQGLGVLRGQLFNSGQSIFKQEDATSLGLSAQVSIIKLLGLIPDTSWLMNTINPSVGVFGGYDFRNGQLVGGPQLSLINIPITGDFSIFRSKKK